MKEAKWKGFTRDEIEQIVKESYSYASLARNLGYCDDSGSSVMTMKTMIKEFDLDVSHFTGQGWLAGKTYTSGQYMPFAEYVRSDHVINSKLSKKLLREGLKEHQCECCKNTTWNGVLIPLEVHHIDGDNSNNELDNLQLLCPNCHALTDNYCGRNIKKKQVKINDDEFVDVLQNSRSINDALVKMNLPSAKYYYERARELINTHNIVFKKCKNEE